VAEAVGMTEKGEERNNNKTIMKHNEDTTNTSSNKEGV